jgi:hypothetical protein
MTESASPKPRSASIPGICSAAKKLGLNPSYLSRVLHGKVYSRQTLKAYFDLIGKPAPGAVRMRSGNEFPMRGANEARKFAEQLGAHRCRVEGSTVVITRNTVFFIEPPSESTAAQPLESSV